MPKRTNQFQTIIADIYRTLAPIGATFEESAMIPEADGTLREVDILIKTQVAEAEVSLAVECRDYSRVQSIEWVDNLIGKYQALPIDKVIAISSSGFSETSILKASRHRIQCLSAAKAEETDWASKFCKPWNSLHYNMHLLHLATYDVNGSKISHTEIDENNNLTHDDLISERLYPTLYEVFADRYAEKIKEEHDKFISSRWTEIADKDKKYFEVTFDTKVIVTPPGEEIRIKRFLFGVGVIFSWKEVESYSQVLHDRVAISISDGASSITIISQKEGDQSAAIFRTEFDQ